MTSIQTDPVPLGKYNAKWCQRQPLVCSNERKHNRALALSTAEELTSSESAAIYLHELVGSQGLEFVVFSNAQLNQPVELPGGIRLVPCFAPIVPETDLDDPIVRATLRMTGRARFIYDGWLPIADWKVEAVRRRIGQVDEALSVLAMYGGVWYSWEPKYSPVAVPHPCYQLKAQHIQDIRQFSRFAESLANTDARAMFRSLGWLSQSLKLTEPAARFLFCILAIESLATYIEEDSDDGSAFAHLRSSSLSRAERKVEREECIRTKLDPLPATELTKAVQSAYSDCVVSITRRVKGHLQKVFAEDSGPVDLFFDTKFEGKTLWDSRHLIAHGRADALSEKQREAIAARVWDAEGLARRYIERALELTIGHPLFQERLTAGMLMWARDAVASSEGIIAGPTHMAVIYD